MTYGRLDEAEKLISVALSDGRVHRGLIPAARVMLLRAELHSRKGHLERALNDCDEALAKLSGFDKATIADILWQKAEVLAALGRKKEAEDARAEAAVLEREMAIEVRELRSKLAKP